MSFRSIRKISTYVLDIGRNSFNIQERSIIVNNGIYFKYANHYVRGLTEDYDDGSKYGVPFGYLGKLFDAHNEVNRHVLKNMTVNKISSKN